MTGDELLEKLREHPKAKAEFVVYGFAKPDPSSNGLMFASNADCKHWIPIPISLIESAEEHGDAQCNDHTHKLVTLRLKMPTSDEGQVFAKLAEFHSHDAIGGPTHSRHGPQSFGPHPMPSKAYRWVIWYNPPFPLSCMAGTNSGCSPVVNAGSDLGSGQFCDYVVLCGGATQTIYYNFFKPWA